MNVLSACRPQQKPLLKKDLVLFLSLQDYSRDINQKERLQVSQIGAKPAVLTQRAERMLAERMLAEQMMLPSVVLPEAYSALSAPQEVDSALAAPQEVDSALAEVLNSAVLLM